MSKIKKQFNGFTIIELLISIAVMAILVTLTIRFYPEYQKRTRDTERKSDVSQIASAIRMYAVQNNNFIEEDSNCGLNGDGNGWLSLQDDSVGYTKSIMSCLRDANLAKEDFIDPSGCLSSASDSCKISHSGNPALAYMKATCTKNGEKITYVMAHLEREARDDAAIDGLCGSGTVDGFDSDGQKWGTNYGMNYYVLIK